MTLEEFKMKQAELMEFVTNPDTGYQAKMTAIGTTLFVLFAAMLALAQESLELSKKKEKKSNL